MTNLLLRDSLDYETKTTHSVTITASKSGQADIVQNLTFHVTDVLETPLSAPLLERTTGPTTYPPEVRFSRPIDWTEGCTAVLQYSTDATFSTGVTDTTNVMLAATTTYDFGLGDIASGSVFIRMAAYTGVRPSDAALTWSNIVNVGDVTAPTITSDDSPSGYKYLTDSMTLAANEFGYWTITGGAGASSFSIDDDVLTWISSSSDSLVVNVKITDYAGNETSQTITLTLADNDPTGISFTDETGATTSTPFTSNTVTLGGGQPGTIWPYSFSGPGLLYIKVGGAGSWLAAGTNGYCEATDQFKIECTSSATIIDTVNNVLTVGDVSDTYSISTSSPVTFGNRLSFPTHTGSGSISVPVEIGTNIYFLAGSEVGNIGPTVSATVDGNATTVKYIGGANSPIFAVIYQSASAHASKTLALTFTGTTNGLFGRHAYMTGFNPAATSVDGWNFDYIHNSASVYSPTMTVPTNGIALAWVGSVETGDFTSAGSGSFLVGHDNYSGTFSEGLGARNNTGAVVLNMGSGSSGYCTLIALTFAPA